MFAFDDDCSGHTDGWDCEIPECAVPIIVPYVYQSTLSGIDVSDYHEMVWYWKEIDVPPSWDGCYVALNFGAVDYHCKIFINGHLAGEHTGGYEPFSVDISSYIDEEGYALIALYVEDDCADASSARGLQGDRASGCSEMTGIWQSVWLEPLKEAHIEDLRWTPDVDSNSALFEAALSNYGFGGSLEVIINYRGEMVARDTISADGHFVRAVVDFEDYDTASCLWSPDNPQLFEATVRLFSGGLFTDEITTYFGMRKFHSESGRLFLNGKPLYPIMAIDKGYWQGGLWTAPADADYQKDILLAKELGFNGVRKYQKIEDPRYLYWADRLGLLVWEEMPGARDFSPDMGVQIMLEWMNAVKRDYSHPCIMAWVPLCESRGLAAIACDEEQQSLSISLVSITKTIDTTRFVISNDGWEHTRSDIVSLKNNSGGAQLQKNYRTQLCAMRSRVEGHKPFAERFRYAKQPIMVTDFGNAQDDYCKLAQVLFASSVVAGVCYCQLFDILDTDNGLYNAQREAKCLSSRIAEVNNDKRSEVDTCSLE